MGRGVAGVLLLLPLTGHAQSYVYTTEEACLSPKPLSCDFYRTCLESAYQCGQTGYALGYGERYCEKFRKIMPEVTARGRKWLEQTMSCLQNRLATLYLAPEASGGGITQDESCRMIAEDAFDSHPYCYTSQPLSICELHPVLDLIPIVTQFEGQDLLTRASGRQARRVARICLSRFAEKLRQSNPGPQELRDQMDYWHQVERTGNY